MKIRLVTLGHRMPAWVSEACQDYLKRMPREVSIEPLELRPVPRRPGLSREQTLALEAERLLPACQGYCLYALDERGLSLRSEAWAERLLRHEQAGESLGFVIGSADGLHDSVLERAQYRLSLSTMTLPHGLVRILLIEQLYRAFMIQRGHPYHRE